MSQALAIVAFTLVVRLLLLPFGMKSSLQMQNNKMALQRLKPELEALKIQYKGEPMKLQQQTMAFYKKHNIQFFSKGLLANMASQGVFGFGMFQALQSMALQSKFLWIANIAKPDILLTFVVSVLTFTAMLAMPGGAEQSSLLLALIPAVISAIVLISLPSAIGVYWATSSLVTLGQNLTLHGFATNKAKVNI
ncbi:membrane protein insertase YidC [Paraferrimonas sp. SM1919]|uniref:YidC/Oxa1 family membrane protein insertase n=1 Tax=Paraferrimonas sp. SM1919 TaxID=2662263 RepID=UPI0013D83C19|nr:membrane protein insertase YidC [Paraferrimonas sp. SM1919]